MDNQTAAMQDLDTVRMMLATAARLGRQRGGAQD